MASYDAPFAGLKVVDLSQGVAGPYCGMLLAQHGADVIKIEPVETGDWTRILGRVYGDHTAYSIPGNLGKRSVALDLKSEDGKAVLWRLLADADVVLEGFRPGVIARLGLDYDAVAARNPRILYLSVSGFGQTGPLAERPAMDPVLQAYTGLMMENRGEDGIPHRIPIIAIDMSTALYAFQAVSGALYARRDQDHGRYIEVSLMQAAASLQVVRMMGTWLEDGAAPVASVPGGVFKTSDGWMQLTVVQQRDWVSLCRAIDLPDLAAEPRFAERTGRIENQDALYAVLRPALAAMTSEDLDRRLADARVMHERLNSYLEFLAQPQVVETGMIAWLHQAGLARPAPMPNLPGLPKLIDGTARAAAPTCGEHTHDVLREHGYSGAEIAELAAQRVIGGLTPPNAGPVRAAIRHPESSPRSP
jgi:crotonobetainyl-CoA:carnitine CoA-transferase CaiB-like acyl-CoA transferase